VKENSVSSLPVFLLSSASALPISLLSLTYASRQEPAPFVAFSSEITFPPEMLLFLSLKAEPDR
jgi:hypothetical protein